ncbi:unnamed protein product [Paramecium primaurelia]|uniref:Uncharacterized protein n=1 Tax=Paramecium primaurelia TaxID=5886 RepID=A0A8S1K360_PARPR|nr:unnamed protein product [Paramecium primaurelia]CAD8047302.1 unnamed protein product [Paramecium primaurelia]
MIQADQNLKSLLIYKKFPLREPFRRSYQTFNVNTFGKKTPDSSFTYSIQKQFKIPIYANKLYKKKTKNIFEHESQSINTSIQLLQPIFIKKTIKIRSQSINEPNLQKNLSKQSMINNIVQNSSNADDSSENSDFQRLKRTYLEKYHKPKVNQIERQPRFQIQSFIEDSLDPWTVDI